MENDEYKKRNAHYVPLTERWKLSAHISDDDWDHLIRSLHGLEKEMPPTISFPLYGRTDIGVIEDFLRLYVDPDPTIPQWMKDYEHGRLSKCGPQGGHKSWEELKPLFDLYQERYVEVMDIPTSTMNQIFDKYSNLHCEMLSIDESLQTLKRDKHIETRAAGCRRFALKKTDEEAQIFAVKDLKSGLYLFFFGYVFSRYNKLKLRLFMPMPFSDMINEARWYNPFLTAIQSDLREKGADSLFTFWADKLGFDECFRILGEAMSQKYSPTQNSEILYVQRDFEKMDTTTGPAQQKFFAQTLGKSFHYGMSSQAMRELLDAMMFPVTCPIATPSGMMVGPHGEASGATVTNGAETVNNDAYDITGETILSDKCNAEGIPYIRLCSAGNGDDGLSIYLLLDKSNHDRFVQIIRDAYSEAAIKHGFIIQSSKWHISNEYGLYCQNMVWYDGCTLHWAYPAVLILNAILNPEHQYKAKDWDPDFRDLNISEKLDNGRNLPYFHKLIDYVDNGMKYHLFRDKSSKTSSRIFSKYEKYRALQPLDERYNRRDWTPMSSPTINYLLGTKSS